MNKPAKPLKRRTRAQILIDALTRELDRAEKEAQRAKAEADECAGITAEFIAINQELSAIIASKEYSSKSIAALEALKKRDQRAKRILNKDYSQLLDVQFNAEADRDMVAAELGNTIARLQIMGEIAA